MNAITFPISALRTILLGAIRKSGARIVWVDQDSWSLGGFYTNKIRR